MSVHHRGPQEPSPAQRVALQVLFIGVGIVFAIMLAALTVWVAAQILPWTR